MHAEQKVEAAPTDRPIFGLPVDTRILFSNKKGIYQRNSRPSRHRRSPNAAPRRFCPFAELA